MDGWMDVAVVWFSRDFLRDLFCTRAHTTQINRLKRPSHSAALRQRPPKYRSPGQVRYHQLQQEQERRQGRPLVRQARHRLRQVHQRQGRFRVPRVQHKRPCARRAQQQWPVRVSRRYCEIQQRQHGQPPPRRRQGLWRLGRVQGQRRQGWQGRRDRRRLRPLRRERVRHDRAARRRLQVRRLPDRHHHPREHRLDRVLCRARPMVQRRHAGRGAVPG